MRHKNIRMSLLALLLCAATFCNAQQGPATLPFTADSLATGTYKDVFRSFFQLAANRLTSPNKELQFTSNPFAVLARLDTNLLVDTNYYKYRRLRRLNFSFGVNLDSGYRFNGFSSGVKYALINKRDVTVSRAFIVETLNANQEFTQLNRQLAIYGSTLATLDLKNRFAEQVDSMFRGTLTFSELDADIQQQVRHFADSTNRRFATLLRADPNLNVKKAQQQTYDSIKANFENNPLLTVGISDTTYTNQFAFSNLVLSAQFLKGVMRPSKAANLQLDLQGFMRFIDDTLNQGRDLKRNLFIVEPGVNLVLKSKATQKSWLEFKLSGAYHHALKGLYASERRDSLTINTTLRVRVFGDVWVPLEINYDPRSGNVFGFLNVRFNFNTMGALLRKEKT